MAYHRNMRHSEVLELPVFANAVGISAGTILVPGTTADQDMGVLIPAPGAGSTAPADIVGLSNRTIAAADRTDADPDGGGSATFGTLEPVALVLPQDLICIEYNEVVDVDVASYSAPTVTITSLADIWDGGWIYATSGTGVGQLGYLEVSASGSVGARDNFTTALDSTTDAILILPIGRLLAAISAVSATAATLLNTYVASTNYVLNFGVVLNELTYRGKDGWLTMTPTLHSNLQLNGLSPRFRSVGYMRNLMSAAID